MNAAALNAPSSLSLPERIDLVEALWDSIAKDAAAVPLMDWQRAELDACLEECRAEPSGGEAWAKAEILDGL